MRGRLVVLLEAPSLVRFVGGSGCVVEFVDTTSPHETPPKREQASDTAVVEAVPSRNKSSASKRCQEIINRVRRGTEGH
jgi:hypothetical protein